MERLQIDPSDVQGLQVDVAWPFPVADADGWIPHDGSGKCPVPADVTEWEIKFRSNVRQSSQIRVPWLWENSGNDTDDVTHWRPLKRRAGVLDDGGHDRGYSKPVSDPIIGPKIVTDAAWEKIQAVRYFANRERCEENHRSLGVVAMTVEERDELVRNLGNVEYWERAARNAEEHNSRLQGKIDRLTAIGAPFPPKVKKLESTLAIRDARIGQLERQLEDAIRERAKVRHQLADMGDRAVIFRAKRDQFKRDLDAERLRTRDLEVRNARQADIIQEYMDKAIGGKPLGKILEEFQALGGRFYGVSAHFRPQWDDWPEAWKVRLITSENGRDEYRLEAYGGDLATAANRLLNRVSLVDSSK